MFQLFHWKMPNSEIKDLLNRKKNMNFIHQLDMQRTKYCNNHWEEANIQLADKVRNLVVCSRTQHEINSVVKEIENINNQVNVLGSKCYFRKSSQVNSLFNQEQTNSEVKL